MLVNSKAIVLRTIKYSDSTLIVDAYTEQGGRRGFLVRIPKTRKASVKNVLFSPMAILNIEWNEHGTSKLTRIKAVQPANIYSDIPFSPAKMAITMFLAEFLSASLRAPMPDRNIFNFIFTSLQWLDDEKGNCANFHIVFLVHLSTYLGLEPNIENCSETSYFDMENGCFTPFRPRHSPRNRTARSTASAPHNASEIHHRITHTLYPRPENTHFASHNRILFHTYS